MDRGTDGRASKERHQGVLSLGRAPLHHRQRAPSAREFEEQVSEEEDFQLALNAAGIKKPDEPLARAVWCALPAIFAARGTRSAADVVSIMYRLASNRSLDIVRRKR